MGATHIACPADNISAPISSANVPALVASVCPCRTPHHIGTHESSREVLAWHQRGGVCAMERPGHASGAVRTTMLTPLSADEIGCCAMPSTPFNSRWNMAHSTEWSANTGPDTQHSCGARQQRHTARSVTQVGTLASLGVRWYRFSHAAYLKNRLSCLVRELRVNEKAYGAVQREQYVCERRSGGRVWQRQRRAQRTAMLDRGEAGGWGNGS